MYSVHTSAKLSSMKKGKVKELSEGSMAGNWQS